MKLLIAVMGLGLGLAVLVPAAFYLFQEKMMFFPGPGRFGDCAAMIRRGAVPVTVADIRYYLLKHPDPRGWVIVFHGNAGNACDRTYFMDLFSGFRVHVAVFEYPGFGKDGNAPGESLILEKAAAMAGHISSLNGSGLPVYLLGESLGTGVAAFVATRTEVSGLILISAYSSLARVARHHYPFLPVTYLMKHRFEAHVWAARTRTPALLFHGTADDIIPIRFAREQSACFGGRSELVEIPNAGHNDITDRGNLVIRNNIREFMIGTSQ